MHDHYLSAGAVILALTTFRARRPEFRESEEADRALRAAMRAQHTALAEYLEDPQTPIEDVARAACRAAEACDDLYCAVLMAGSTPVNRYATYPTGSAAREAAEIYKLACVAMREAARA